jgi:hypothetical protein
MRVAIVAPVVLWGKRGVLRRSMPAAADNNGSKAAVTAPALRRVLVIASR